MTRYTAPNQKIIRVHKDSYNGSYLTIGTEEWQEAFKSLKRITFGVYLYLSGNANGFELTLSRRDVMDRLGVSKDTYLRAVKELEEKGYLTHKNGPVWNFYTTPVDMEADAKETGANETGVNESDDDNENNENHESGNNESGNYEESNESESGENMGGMVAYTQPSCMRRSNHNGSVEATDMVAYTHTEINKYRETYNTDRVGSDEPPNTHDENTDEKSINEKGTDEKSKRDTMNAKDEENIEDKNIEDRENQRDDEWNSIEERLGEENEATRKEERGAENQMKKVDPKEKEGSKGGNRWVNDIDFLESLSEEEMHDMYDSFHTERRLDSNGLKRFLLDRYGVRVRDVRRFCDNLCMYCEE